MVRFKRQEGFRFSFHNPIPALFTIEELNGNVVKSSEGEAKLMDLSPNGMKLNTTLDIPVSKRNRVKVSVRFNLNDTTYQVHGEIVWREERFNHFFYGIHFVMDNKEQTNLVESLKCYVKSISNESENDSDNDR